MGPNKDYYQQQLEEVNRRCEEEQFGEAIGPCGKLVLEARESGDEAFEFFFEGEKLALAGELRRAARLQEKAAEQLGRVPFVLGNCAVILSMAGKPLQAVEYLDRVLDVERDNLQALGQKGVSLAKMGYDQEALACFERILELDPGQHHALRNKAVSLSRLGEEQGALDILEGVLRENPGDSHARSERTILLDEMHLRGTPLGWLLLWIRKRLGPTLMRLRYRLPQSA